MAIPASIRPARETDLGEVVAIYNHYVETTAVSLELRPTTVEARRPWYEAHSRGGSHRLLVAEDAAGALRGWASTSEFRPRTGYATTVESSVYCRPDSCGAGLGSRLYEELLRAVEAEEVERIVAGVTLPNAASIRLHRRFGFQKVGTFTRVGRKFGRFWDVAWFERPARLEPRTVISTVTDARRAEPERERRPSQVSR